MFLLVGAACFGVSDAAAAFRFIRCRTYRVVGCVLRDPEQSRSRRAVPSLPPVRLPSSLLLAVLCASACGFPNHRHDLRIWETLPTESAGLSGAFLQSTGVPLREGNRVELLGNGDVFDALEEEVLAARRSVHIVIYIWQPGAPSDRLLRALGHRRKGVACRVLVDPLQSQRFDEVTPLLSALGCEWRISRPMEGSVRTFDAARMRARNHRKIFIRDGTSGITGGLRDLAQLVG